MARQAELWFESHRQRCVARSEGEALTRRATSWREWTFSLRIPRSKLERDRALGHGLEPFLAIFTAPVPRGQTVAGLIVEAPNAQAVVTSFVRRGVLLALVECSTATEQVRVHVELEPGAAPARRVRAGKLHAFGHRFLIEHRRLPTAAEVATALRLSAAETEALLERTHSPVCADDVVLGALPRLRIGAAAPPRPQPIRRKRFDTELSRDGFAAPSVVEEVAKDFEVTRARIRPIEVAALRKLRHPKVASRLRSFVED